MIDYVAVIVADQDSAELAELTGQNCLSLLPVAGKPLLFHTIESLALAAITQVHILAGSHADPIRKAVGDGRRWGLRIDVSALPGASLDAVAKLWTNAGALILRADQLRSPRMGALMGHAGQLGRVFARMSGDDGGAVLTTPGSDDGVIVDIGGECRSIASAQDYYRANLDAISGAVRGLLLGGRHLVQDGDDELIACHGSSVSADSLVGGKAWIGEFCKISRQARLDGLVVIGASCIIAEGTTITDSVVLPGTYVGPDLDIRNAIVAGSTIWQVDSGATARIADPFLLSALLA